MKSRVQRDDPLSMLEGDILIGFFEMGRSLHYGQHHSIG